ncbi:MAG: hypothetical protein MI757_11065 [Pirellulales bacterium]|nr:hypothetical protein [Pirellulales bacterium]
MSKYHVISPHLLKAWCPRVTNAVLAESLRLLESQEKLRAEVREGFAQFDRGEGIDADIVYREVEAVIEQVAREQSKD